MEVTVIGNSDVGKVAKPCFGLVFWIVFVEAFLSLLFVLVGFSFWFVSFCLFEGFFFCFVWKQQLQHCQFLVECSLELRRTSVSTMKPHRQALGGLA